VTHDELIETMIEVYMKEGLSPGYSTTGFRAILRVVAEELLGEMKESEWDKHMAGPNSIRSGVNGIFASRLSRYIQPKRDPAVVAVNTLLGFSQSEGTVITGGVSVEKIVAAVRKADSKRA
jgi:hypothetical protein